MHVARATFVRPAHPSVVVAFTVLAVGGFGCGQAAGDASAPPAPSAIQAAAAPDRAPAAPAAPSAPQAPARSEADADDAASTDVTMVAVGDVLPHLMVKGAARARARRPAEGPDTNHAGFGPLFEGLRGFVERHDLATFNMESPVVDAPRLPHARMRFFSPVALPAALADVGFDLAVCANNHAFDQGEGGVVETHTHLGALGLGPVGCGPTLAAASAHRLFEVRGLRIAVLSFTRLSNAFHPGRRAWRDRPQALFWYDEGDSPDVPGGPGAEVLAAIAAAKAEADVVVVNAHWDREYQPTPLPETRALARVLVDAGVDLVVGHHPHVLEPAEWMAGPAGRRAAVIYSLGNFISEMCANRAPRDLCDRRLSAFAVARFRKTEAGGALVGLSFEPAWMDHADRCPGEAEGEVRAGCVRPVVVADEVARLEAESAAATDPDARATLALRIEGYRLRASVVRAFLGPHPEGGAPRSPYVGVDPALVARSRHGAPRRRVY